VASSLADENTSASFRRENYIGSANFAFASAWILPSFSAGWASRREGGLPAANILPAPKFMILFKNVWLAGFV
jgi:hypothetical protein